MKLRLVVVLFALAAAPGIATAFTFAEGFRLALEADPQFRSARFERDSGRIVLPMAQAQMRPNVSINASETKIMGTRDFTSTVEGQPTSSPLDYTSRQRGINLRMPLLNLEGRTRIRQAEVQVSFADAVFAVRGKDLATRYARAYTDLLLALESVRLADAQVETLREQIAFSNRRLSGGEGTRTEVAESEARLDIALAQRIEAKDQVEVARRTLQFIVGTETLKVVAPLSRIRATPLEPANLAAWLELGENRSPEVLARRYRVESAKFEVERQRTGHYPRIDGVASVSWSKSDTINTIDSAISQRTIGLQLNLPIYSGGSVVLATEQALAQLRQSEFELEAELNNQRVEIRRQFLAVANGIARLDAFERAVASSEVALNGTRMGLRAGLRTNVDVLDAQRQVYSSRRDLAQAQYQYLLANLQLRIAAGEAPEQAVEAADRMLASADRPK